MNTGGLYTVKIDNVFQLFNVHSRLFLSCDKSSNTSLRIPHYYLQYGTGTYMYCLQDQCFSAKAISPSCCTKKVNYGDGM